MLSDSSYRGLFIFKLCSRLYFFVVFPFPVATAFSVSVGDAHRTVRCVSFFNRDEEMEMEIGYGDGEGNGDGEGDVYEDGGRRR